MAIADFPRFLRTVALSIALAFGFFAAVAASPRSASAQQVAKPAPLKQEKPVLPGSHGGDQNASLEADQQKQVGHIYYADGHVDLLYDNTRLRADHVEYDEDAQIAKASGHVQLDYETQHVEADDAVYELKTGKGTFHHVRATFAIQRRASPTLLISPNPIYFEAEVAERVDQMMLEKVDAAVYLAAFYLFYMQYFFLFTVFAGATPGMQLRELTIVRLDGTLPDTRQLLWRAFGYAMSGATFMLGFVWSTWDEDKFTWHDRISQTYVTAAMPSIEPDAFEVPVTPRAHFAHK